MLTRYPIATRPGSLATRQSKALGRHLDALHAGTSLELADVRAIETVEVEKIRALQGVGKAAIGAGADIAAERRFRLEYDPTAAPELCLITSKVAMAIGERVDRASRRLG